MATDPLDFLDSPSERRQSKKISSDPLDFLDQKGKAKKSARVGAQYGLGQLDRAALPYTAYAQLQGSKAFQSAEYRQNLLDELERLADLKRMGQWDEQDEKNLQSIQAQLTNPDVFEEKTQHIKPYDITPSGLVKKGIKATTDYDLEPEGALEKTAEFVGGFKPKEIVSAGKKIGEFGKKIATKNKQTLPSGLSKPGAVDSKIAPYTSIGKETQKRAIEKLNIEAGHLAKEKVYEHLPVAKKIEEGFNFDTFFKNRFSNLEKAAKRSNARVDITPMTELFEKTAEKYRGIPKLHSDAKKIMAEHRAFYDKAPTTVSRLLKTYRSNNAKLKSIFETSRLKGSQKEYADFLVDQNKAIAASFRESLGKDNAWVKEFDRLNNGFKTWRNGQKTLQELDGFFGGRLTPRSLEKLGNDPRTQQKMALSIGEQGAKEIGQIAKDLKLAQDSIKNIPKAKLAKYDMVLPLTYLIPVVGKATGSIGSIILARNILGSLLSKPATKRAYKEALNALINKDFQAYEAAASVILKAAKHGEED
jgi:hypothetical protein